MQTVNTQDTKLKTYSFSFYGRQTGAIGIFYNIKDSYEAHSFEEACSMLYVDYDHITFHSASSPRKQYSKEDFNKAVSANFKTDYKGKGMLRK
jgi:hypothetical protein